MNILLCNIIMHIYIYVYHIFSGIPTNSFLRKKKHKMDEEESIFELEEKFQEVRILITPF